MVDFHKLIKSGNLPVLSKHQDYRPRNEFSWEGTEKREAPPLLPKRGLHSGVVLALGPD